MEQDIIKLVIDTHKKFCEIKKMGEKAAFGHDPAIFYGLALSGECGAFIV